MKTSLQPILVEYIGPASTRKKFGDQYVLGKFYADQDEKNGMVKIIREMPEGTPYGDYKCSTE